MSPVATALLPLLRVWLLRRQCPPPHSPPLSFPHRKLIHFQSMRAEWRSGACCHIAAQFDSLSLGLLCLLLLLVAGLKQCAEGVMFLHAQTHNHSE